MQLVMWPQGQVSKSRDLGVANNMLRRTYPVVRLNIDVIATNVIRVIYSEATYFMHEVCSCVVTFR